MPAFLGHAARPVRRAIAAGLRVASDPAAYLPDRGRRPTDHPTIGVVGFYGNGNYGDELFLRVFGEHLGGDAELVGLLPPAQPGIGPTRPLLRRAVREVDAVLIGGGDLVIPWRPGRYWSPHLLRRPVVVAGVGVPTWRGPEPGGLAALRRFLRDPAVRYLAARDRTSRDWIERELRPAVPVRLTSDLVFALTLPPATPPPGPPIFGITVRQRSDSETREDLADDLGHVRALGERATALGFRVRRIVLGTGAVRRNDLRAFARLGLDDTELVSTDDLDAISRAVGECRVLATMKFHGLVAAAMYGVIPISLMATKSKRLLAEADRLDLQAGWADPDLAAFADRDLAPIARPIVDGWRRAAVETLSEVRAAILSASAEGR